MSEKKKKGIAVFLYAAYAVFLTLLLIFGAKAASLAYKIVKGQLDRVHISDVIPSVGEDEQLLAGKVHYIDYVSHGNFRGDDGLKFESLDPDHLTVTGRGRLKASVDFEGDSFVGRVKVTSKYDTKFEKILSFTFIKKYPDKFSCYLYVRGYKQNSKILYLGIPVYVFSHVDKDVEYNVKDYEIIYDEEYFEIAEDGAFIPIKVSEEKLSFKIVYDNGAKEIREFTIAEPPTITEFDDVYFDKLPSSEFVGKPGDSIDVTIMKDGKAVPTLYTVTYEDGEEIVHNKKTGNPQFRTAGDKQVTFTLPNGFSKTVTIKIESGLRLPTLTDKSASETHRIEILDTEVRTFNATFPSGTIYKDMTFEYDKSIISVDVSGQSFTVTPKSIGTATLKLVIDDGSSRVEDVYTVEVVRNKNIVAVIWRNVQIFVSKVLGHMSLFACLAVLAMNLFKYCYILDPFARLITYLLMGLPFAAITEYAQTFIPGRSGRVQDVLIDMAGFIVGTLLVILYRLLRDKIKLAHENREKAIMRKRRKGIKARENLRSKRKV